MDIKPSEYDLGNLTDVCMDTLASAIEFRTSLLSGRIDAIVKLAKRLKVRKHDGRKKIDWHEVEDLCDQVAVTLFGKKCSEVENICPDSKGHNPFVTDRLWEEARLAAAIRYHSVRDKGCEVHALCGIKPKVLDGVVMSLDWFSRMGMGQLWVLSISLRDSLLFTEGNGDSIETTICELDRLFASLSKILYSSPSPYMSYGITSKEVPTECKLAYDMQQVISHRMGWDRAGNPPVRDWSKMLGYIYDDPMNLSGLPFITITASDGFKKTAY